MRGGTVLRGAVSQRADPEDGGKVSMVLRLQMLDQAPLLGVCAANLCGLCREYWATFVIGSPLPREVTYNFLKWCRPGAEA